MIMVAGVVAVPSDAMVREVDFHVPVTHRVKRYASVVEGYRRIVQVRPGGAMGVELRIPPDAGEITETVVLGLAGPEGFLDTEGVPVVDGIPALAIPVDAFDVQGDLLVSDHDLPIAIGLAADAMDVVFGPARTVDLVVRSGSTDYLVAAGCLAGIRFARLAIDEVDALRECRMRQSG